MTERSPRFKLYEWRITCSIADAFFGYVVEAPDAEQAIQAAIAQYGIDNPQQQARLAAQRVREVG